MLTILKYSHLTVLSTGNARHDSSASNMNNSEVCTLLMGRTHLLDIYFNVFLQTVAIQIQDKIMYKVKTVTHYNKGKLVCELCFLQEIFNSFRIVAIGFPAYPLHFFDLASLACCL